MGNRIFISNSNDDWIMNCKHCQRKVYSTQNEALEKAVHHGASLPKGIISEVLLQSDGEFRIESVYGLEVNRK